MRIPERAVSACIDGKAANVGYNTVRRIWDGKCEVKVAFGFDIKVEERAAGMVSVSRGNLVFALPIGVNWVMREYTRSGVERKLPYCDYYKFPTTPWNYALNGDRFTFECGRSGALFAGWSAGQNYSELCSGRLENGTRLLRRISGSADADRSRDGA